MFTNKSKTAGDEQLKEDENLRLIQRKNEGQVPDGVSPEPWAGSFTAQPRPSLCV